MLKTDRMSKGLFVGFASVIEPASALADLGQDCAQDRNLDLQVQACSDIINRDPTAAWAYANRSMAHMTRGDHDRGITDATKAIEIDPRLAMAYVSRAGNSVGKGD